MLFSVQNKDSHSYFFFFLIFFATLFCLPSCSQYLYTPTATNMPNLRKQGELNLQGSVGNKNPSFGASVSAEYAATSNIGLSAKVIASGHSAFEMPKSWGMEQLDGSGRYAEIAAGHYAFQAQDVAMKEGVSITAFGGLGLGKFTSLIMDPTNESHVMDVAEIKFSTVFVQPAAIIRHNYFDLGLSVRIGYVNFYKGTFTGDNFRFRSTYSFFQNHNSFVVLEPAAQLWINSTDNLRFTVFAALTSMPAEIATTSIWGLGAQFEFGGMPKLRRPKSVPLPFFDPNYMPLPQPSIKKFNVCK